MRRADHVNFDAAKPNHRVNNIDIVHCPVK